MRTLVIAHRSGPNSSAAPATAAPVLRASCVFAADHTRASYFSKGCLLLFQRIPQHSSLTSQRKRLPPRLPQQGPSTSRARRLLPSPPRQMCKLLNAITPISHTSTCLESGNNTPNHYYHTPCYQTPCRRPGVWQQHLQPLFVTTPLLSHPYLLGVWQPNFFATTHHTLSSHPAEYTTPVISFVKSQHSQPLYHRDTL